MSGRAVFGLHAVRVLVRTRPTSISEVVLSERRRDGRTLALERECEQRGVEVRKTSGRELEAIVPEAVHQGVLAVLEERPGEGDRGREASGWKRLVETFRAYRDAPAGGGAALALALDGVQDPHNLGACVRSATAAVAQAVLTRRRGSVGVNSTVIKVATGATEYTPVIPVGRFSRALTDLARTGATVIGADPGSDRPLWEVDLTGSVVIVLGGEHRGLRRLTTESCDWLVGIPMAGPVESLNVSVAAGICLFEVLRQRHEARTRLA